MLHSRKLVLVIAYSHVTPGLQEAAARHFDEAFNPRYNEMADKVRHASEANEKAC